MLYKHMILDDVGVTKKIWSDYILVTFWLHIMVYGYTESDVIAESRGWNAMSGDNDVVCVLWICVVVGTESYVCDQLPKLPEEPPPIGDCAVSTGWCAQVGVPLADRRGHLSKPRLGGIVTPC